MSKETELKLDYYRSDIEATIRSWFQSELDALDKDMMYLFELKQKDEWGAAATYDRALATKEAVLRQVSVLVNEVVIGFAKVLERLEESGVIYIPQVVIKDSLTAYLDYLGVKLGKIEGAVLDTSWGTIALDS